MTVTTVSVQVSSIPTGIVYSFPILITNSQSSPTPAPFQQMIVINSAVYASYEAPNLQNVEFFNADGTIIPSWLESGSTSTSTNTIYWLKLPSGIPALSSITIYMGFASPSANLFNAQTTGEAAQLSTLYGEYDDGASIFGNYLSFAGTSLPAGWSEWTTGSGSVTVNNGLTVTTAGQTQSGAAALSNIPTTSGVIEGSVSAFSNGDNSNIEALVASTSSTSFTFSPNCVGWQNGQQLEIENNNGGTPNVISASSINPAAPFVLGVYGDSLYVNYNLGATINASILGTGYLSIEAGSGTTVPSITYNWIRTRALPPNGMMPTVTISGQTQTQPSVATGLAAISGATVLVEQNSLSLSPGAQLYVYGLVTGGGFPTTNFTDGPYTSVSNADGLLVAALAATSSDANSFTTQTAYYDVGGVAVSGFSQYASSYGSNPSPRATGASDTFTVTTPGSLVVVFGLGGGEQCLALSGVPGLTTDATDNGTGGLPPVITIAHAYLGPGLYTASEETQQCAGGQDPNHAADLIGVFVFTSGSAATTGPTTTGPAPTIASSTIFSSITSGPTSSTSGLVIMSLGSISAVIGIIVVVALILVFLTLWRRRRIRTKGQEREPGPEVAQKLERLKRMLDLGLITPDDYEEQRRRLGAS
jgi:uncharacterized membrane protein